MANAAKTIEVPKADEVMALVKVDHDEVSQFSEALKGHKIQKQGHLKYAVGALALVKEKAIELAAKKATIVDPLEQALKATKALFSPVEDDLDEIEKTMKAKVVGYYVSQEETRVHYLSLVEGSSGGERKAYLDRAEECEVDKVPGLSMRSKVGISVTDQKKAVDWCLENDRHELLTINEKVLKALLKDRELDIPGVAVLKGYTAAITVDKVEK